MGLIDLIKDDERLNGLEGLELLEKAILELDEKIHLVVGYTTDKKESPSDAHSKFGTDTPAAQQVKPAPLINTMTGRN